MPGEMHGATQRAIAEWEPLLGGLRYTQSPSNISLVGEEHHSHQKLSLAEYCAEQLSHGLVQPSGTPQVLYREWIGKLPAGTPPSDVAALQQEVAGSLGYVKVDQCIQD